jgi:hypothetical protein
MGTWGRRRSSPLWNTCVRRSPRRRTASGYWPADGTCSSESVCSTASSRRPACSNWPRGPWYASTPCTFSSPTSRARTRWSRSGTRPERAAAKVGQEARRVRSRVHRALADVGASDPDNLLLDWTDLEQNPGYLKLRDLVRTAFDDDHRFRASCLAVSRAYLRHRGETPTEQQVAAASEYFLNELPIGMDTPSILGVPESLCAYHRVLAFADADRSWLACPFSQPGLSHGSSWRLRAIGSARRGWVRGRRWPRRGCRPPPRGRATPTPRPAPARSPGQRGRRSPPATRWCRHR